MPRSPDQFFTAQVTFAQLSEFSIWASKARTPPYASLDPRLIWLGRSNSGARRLAIVEHENHLRPVHPRVGIGAQVFGYNGGFEALERQSDSTGYLWLGFEPGDTRGFMWSSARWGNSILVALAVADPPVSLTAIGLQKPNYLLCCYPYYKRDLYDPQYPSGYMWYFRRNHGIIWKENSKPPPQMNERWFHLHSVYADEIDAWLAPF